MGVTPHFCRIEDKPIEFYEQFHIIVLGLDSLEARRYMNQVACSFLGAPADRGRYCTCYSVSLLAPSWLLHKDLFKPQSIALSTVNFLSGTQSRY